MSSKPKSPAQSPVTEPDVPDDIGRIRDIIFGRQMQEYANRFDELERQVADSLQRMSKELDQRFDKLEQSLERGTAALAAQLTTEAEARSAALAAMQDSVAADHESLTRLVEKTRAELSEASRDDAERLERQKVTSSDLAQLLTELARKIEQGDR